MFDILAGYALVEGRRELAIVVMDVRGVVENCWSWSFGKNFPIFAVRWGKSSWPIKSGLSLEAGFDQKHQPQLRFSSHN